MKNIFKFLSVISFALFFNLNAVSADACHNYYKLLDSKSYEVDETINLKVFHDITDIVEGDLHIDTNVLEFVSAKTFGDDEYAIVPTYTTNSDGTIKISWNVDHSFDLSDSIAGVEISLKVKKVPADNKTDIHFVPACEDYNEDFFKISATISDKNNNSNIVDNNSANANANTNNEVNKVSENNDIFMYILCGENILLVFAFVIFTISNKK